MASNRGALYMYTSLYIVSKQNERAKESTVALGFFRAVSVWVCWVKPTELPDQRQSANFKFSSSKNNNKSSSSNKSNYSCDMCVYLYFTCRSDWRVLQNVRMFSALWTKCVWRMTDRKSFRFGLPRRIYVYICVYIYLLLFFTADVLHSIWGILCAWFVMPPFWVFFHI